MNDRLEEEEAPIEVQGEISVPSAPAVSAAITVAIPGVVTQQIGSGEHAQNSIVYRTILWSFIGGGLLSAAAVLVALMKGNASALSEVKDVWSIFAPLITLSLGYLFGKGR